MVCGLYRRVTATDIPATGAIHVRRCFLCRTRLVLTDAHGSNCEDIAEGADAGCYWSLSLRSLEVHRQVVLRLVSLNHKTVFEGATHRTVPSK